jgi:acetylornithine/N-succinyldiaminopimelate aminotransferase
MARQHLMKTYAPQPIAFTHGNGVWLWDEAGNRYLDALAGIAVSGLGHNHPDLVRTISEQARRIIHTSNLFEIREQERAAEQIATLAGMDNVFFGNSGAEANECAIKLARLYGKQKGIAEPQIIVMEKAWHGRTLATLAATGSKKAQAGFEPLMGGFIRVPYQDIAAIEAVARSQSNVVAVLLEVLQGEGGIHVASDAYLKAVRALCDQHGWLLMIDEVQSGVGRTGKWFAHQWAGIACDVMPLAKGIGSGVPVGACVARGAAAEVFKPGNHGTTFGGGPLVAAVVSCTLDVMERDGLLANAAQQGTAIMNALKSELGSVAGVKEVRGQGLMLGIELDRPCGEIVKQGLAAGLVINVTADSVVRLLPPLIINASESEQLVAKLVPVIRSFLAQSDAAKLPPAKAA